MDRRCACAWLLALLVWGGPAAAADDEVDWCAGRIAPLEELLLRAPRGLEPAGCTLRILALARDGARVRPGEVVAELGAPERAARERLEAALRRAQAAMDRALAGLEVELGELEGRLARARLAQQKAALEVKKKAALSRRDAQLVDLAARRADFEVEALRRTLAVRQAVLAATRADHQARLEQARQALAEHGQARARLSLRAPADGQVRLRPFAELGRPVRVGDRLPQGAEVVGLALGGRLAVEFLVPEGLLARAALGAEVRVQALPPGAEARARVTWVDAQPRWVAGGVAYRARAELPAETTGLRLGQAVRVAPAPGPEPPSAEVGRGPLTRGDERVGVLESVARTPLRAPEVPGLHELEVDSAPAPGARVVSGEVLLVFERAEVEARLREIEQRAVRLRTRQALAVERRRSRRLARELALARAGLDEERAALLAISGVGLRPELQLAAARLDHELASLEARLAREALEAHDGRAAQAEVEARQEAAELEAERVQAQGFLRRLALAAPSRGRVASVRPERPLGPGSRVRAGEVVLLLEEEGRLQVRLCVPASRAAAWSAVERLVLEPLAFPGAGWPARQKGLEPGCPGEEEGLGLRFELERAEPQARPGLRVRARLEEGARIHAAPGPDAQEAPR